MSIVPSTEATHELYLSKADMAQLVDIGLQGMGALADNQKAQDMIQQLALAIIGSVNWEISSSVKQTPSASLRVTSLFDVVGKN